jgi:hypothetical protein
MATTILVIEEQIVVDRHLAENGYECANPDCICHPQRTLIVGTWVQVRSHVDEYAGMIGPIDWIEEHRAADDNNPYGVDLADAGTSIFFAADELCVLPGKPEGDSRLTRLVVLDGTEFLLVATSLAQLDADEQELREVDKQFSRALTPAADDYRAAAQDRNATTQCSDGSWW